MIDLDLKGTKTEANLMAAYSAEAKARNDYTFYAQKARTDGYEQIAKIFEETANNEKEHAEIWFKYLHDANAPTAENLKSAQSEELFEHSQMYPAFAQQAREEGFDHIAFLFDSVAKIEQQHEERFKKLCENIQNGMVFSREGDTVWICSNCGHVEVGRQAPQVCPVCSHAQSYFEIKASNY